MSEKKVLYQSPGETGKRGFEDLECYKLALEVMADVHTFSKTLPSDERFDLYTQIRRSSKGVTGNMGEAYGRYHYLDSLHLRPFINQFAKRSRHSMDPCLMFVVNVRGRRSMVTKRHMRIK